MRLRLKGVGAGYRWERQRTRTSNSGQEVARALQDNPTKSKFDVLAVRRGERRREESTGRRRLTQQQNTTTLESSRLRDLQYIYNHGGHGRECGKSPGDCHDLQDQRIEGRKYPAICIKRPYFSYKSSADASKYHRPRNEIRSLLSRKNTRRSGRKMASFNPMHPPRPKYPSIQFPPQKYEVSTRSSSAQWPIPI